VAIEVSRSRTDGACLRLNRMHLNEASPLFQHCAVCSISADQSGIHKVARSGLLGRNSSPGGSREDKDAKEEAVLKSEKLNYIAVKNDARGFSVS